MKHRTGTALALLMAALFAPPTSAQAPPPDADWRTLRTEHFRVTHTPELAPVARYAALVAERTHAVLQQELADPPRGMIDLVVTDHADYSNGLARPFPSNRITVLVRPAMGEFFARDWIELVVAHEVVHIFHLDQSGALGNVVRALFGRIPVLWPVFSVAGTPAWNTEGIATHYESRLTGGGRVHSSIHDMFIRTAALEGGLPDLDAVSTPSPVWPAGNRSYIYGARLMRYIADAHGPEVHGELVDATVGSIWPTFLRFHHVSKNVVGTPFDVLYDEWRAAATDTAEAVADRVRRHGETETRPVAGAGPYAVAPRVSPDGRQLSFAAADWRSPSTTRVVELATGESRRVGERNQFGALLGPASWLPGGGWVISQLEFRDPYRLHSDLWHLDAAGREIRLTEGARLIQPDVAPDGGRVAGAQHHRGGVRLVVHDLAAGETRAVAEAEPGEAYDGPRWSPDGRRIAAGLNAGGRIDLVLVDPATGAVSRVTDDPAIDLAPAWSPDGRWLLWWSDRTGIPNIMAVAVEDGRPTGPVRQVTNVIAGVMDPEVDPDGETLYLSAYHADGWRIEAMPFRPDAWREAPPPEERYTDGVLSTAGESTESGEPDASAELDASGSYSPWPTLRPYAWQPTFRQVGSAESPVRFLGVLVDGTDVVARHSWSLEAAGGVESRRYEVAGQWVYRGLGTPDLFAAAGRRWLSAGSVDFGSGTERILARSDRVVAGARFQRRRYRTNATVRVTGALEQQAYEGRDLTHGQLMDVGVVLPTARTLAGVSVRPGFGSARTYPFSISPEDGIGAELGIGRWWDVGRGRTAYDELSGRLTGYLGAPVWGFADHVLAARVAAQLRSGADAPLRSVGGVGSTLPLVGTDGSDLPVRGFDAGARFGTRAWSANLEWRFPLHLRKSPGSFLGVSLVAVSGALFADAGDAWCTDRDQRRIESCSTTRSPLVSGGGELQLDLGVMHGLRIRVSGGVAQPIRGPGTRPVFYLGTAF